ncbi:hypothetical protein AOC36_04780 [Erysipelothrix larvae]|uniref:Holliday junction branch migration complex subunit RuvA n=1 Tax=Erysipelothrix larvae TaxID=1514105 RepID=A0A0X8GZJ4_9FIRM|nr:Holliday junction branch migration protein RuvA [Erysipelothrix larvae]AMC93312.1 hypothetical protein AOC36_04780 [Erysipelothrix larvae]
MIAYVSGTCVFKEEDAVIIDVNGLGYQVFCPTTHSILVNHNITLHTYYYVREDAILLYGFESREDLNLFNRLITVKGVGPRVALGIMKKVPSSDLVNAIEAGNHTYLKTMPGVGPKMASQIVLDLKGKLVSASSNAPVSKFDGLFEDVAVALGDLGFKRGEINSIKTQLHESRATDINTLIKQALKLLAR